MSFSFTQPFNSEMIIRICAAFAASIWFGIRFNVRLKFLLWAGLAGALSCSLFFFLGQYQPSPIIRNFYVAVVCAFYAEMMAWWKKVPSTVFLLPSVLPLMPGGSLYTSMSCAVHNDWGAFTAHITHTLLIASAAAAGIVWGMTLVSVWRKFRTESSASCRRWMGSSTRPGK